MQQSLTNYSSTAQLRTHMQSFYDAMCEGAENGDIEAEFSVFSPDFVYLTGDQELDLYDCRQVARYRNADAAFLFYYIHVNECVLADEHYVKTFIIENVKHEDVHGKVSHYKAEYEDIWAKSQTTLVLIKRTLLTQEWIMEAKGLSAYRTLRLEQRGLENSDVDTLLEIHPHERHLLEEEDALKIELQGYYDEISKSLSDEINKSPKNRDFAAAFEPCFHRYLARKHSQSEFMDLDEVKADLKQQYKSIKSVQTSAMVTKVMMFSRAVAVAEVEREEIRTDEQSNISIIHTTTTATWWKRGQKWFLAKDQHGQTTSKIYPHERLIKYHRAKTIFLLCWLVFASPLLFFPIHAWFKAEQKEELLPSYKAIDKAFSDHYFSSFSRAVLAADYPNVAYGADSLENWEPLSSESKEALASLQQKYVARNRTQPMETEFGENDIKAEWFRMKFGQETTYRTQITNVPNFYFFEPNYQHVVIAETYADDKLVFRSQDYWILRPKDYDQGAKPIGTFTDDTHRYWRIQKREQLPLSR